MPPVAEMSWQSVGCYERAWAGTSSKFHLRCTSGACIRDKRRGLLDAVYKDTRRFRRTCRLHDDVIIGATASTLRSVSAKLIRDRRRYEQPIMSWAYPQ